MSILLVDDSRTVLHVMAKMLKELGYSDIMKAQNCEEARLIIKSTKGIPDLIISDWNMPGESGLDLLKYIRGDKKTASIPFILLTSDQDRTKIFQAKQYNPQFYLLKPCQKLSLAERLMSLAKTHGIQPPDTGGKLPEIDAQNEVSGHDGIQPVKQTESKGTTNSDEIAEILNQCIFVLTGRKNIAELRAFLGQEIFGISPEQIRLQHIHELSNTLHTVIEQTLHSIFNDDEQMP